MAWKYYTDAACTQEFGGVFNLIHYSDFSDNPQDRVLYLAEVENDPADNGSTKIVRRDASNIVVRVVDANVGTGHEATEIKLATTALGLDTAIAGASLSLGTQIVSGVTQAQPIYVRVVNAVPDIGTSLELSLRINETVWLSNT